MDEITTQLTNKISDIQNAELALKETEQELMDNPQFKKFLDLQKSVNEKASEVWKYVEEQMIKHDIKQLKGEFGTISIAQRVNWSTDDTLPSKFYKKVVDTKKITDTFKLEGKVPKGATPSYTKYLTKRLK